MIQPSPSVFRERTAFYAGPTQSAQRLLAGLNKAGWEVYTAHTQGDLKERIEGALNGGPHPTIVFIGEGLDDLPQRQLVRTLKRQLPDNDVLFAPGIIDPYKNEKIERELPHLKMINPLGQNPRDTLSHWRRFNARLDKIVGTRNNGLIFSASEDDEEDALPIEVHLPHQK